MREENSEIKFLGLGQILLASFLVFVLLAVTLIKKVWSWAPFDFISGILSVALLITFMLIVQPFAKKFEGNPVEALKFISAFLFSLILISFVFKNLINVTKQDNIVVPSLYGDVVMTNLFSVIYIFLVAVVFSIFMKVLFLGRGREVKVKFILTLAFFAIYLSFTDLFESLSKMLRAVVFEPGIAMIILLFLFMWISIRIPWVISLRKREKYLVLLFSSLTFIFVIFHGSPLITGGGAEALRFYSPLLFSFAHYYFDIFIGVYSFFVFVSTIFHLPTTEIYERKVAELSTLQNIGKLVAQMLDIREFSETALKIAMEITNSKSALIEIKLAENEIIHRGIGTDTEKLKEITADKNLDKHLVVNFDDGDVLIAPLIAHGKTSGYLSLMKKEGGFDADTLNLALAFADQIAIGVENYKLVMESIEKERLLREFELARQIQKKLLPGVLPKSNKFEMSALSSPAFEVGGDYYDFVVHKDGNLSFIVADVSGKGVSAAFYMAEIKGIFQSISKIYKNPTEFLLAFNDAVYGHVDKKFFITLIYAYFDVKNGSIQIARAGHLPPIFVRGKKVEFLKPPGPGIGLMETKMFERYIKPVKLKLEKDDLLIFYSDGVIEAMNKSWEEFGYNRFADFVLKISEKETDKITRLIFEEIEKYREGEQTFADDLTILAIKWKK
jgi:sigma-B regulation protein RsbU (phosphoserine phosphatase)